ncbi:transposase [Paraburkholderia phymatum]|uniref:transposase n=1 Tax=Paraburkholderia phymatum TaxID=148447 RepID=UPI00317C537F
MSFEPLSDQDWDKIAHLFPHNGMRRYGRVPRDPRELLNAILWVLTQNERWHHLPRDGPPAQTCYIKYRQWCRDGTLDKVADALGIALPLSTAAAKREEQGDSE